MKYSKINPELFVRNRNKLIGKLEKNSVAIIHSNDQMVRNGDQFYPFRQNSDLFYLSGIEQEMSVLLIDLDGNGEKNEIMLFIRKPDPNLETWEGRKLDKENAFEISGIKTIKWLEDFERNLNVLMHPSKIIYFNIPEFAKFKPEYPSRDERKMMELKTAYPSHEFKQLSPLLTELRLEKEPEEIELIRKAISITRAGFERVLGFIKPGLMEFEVEAEFSHEFFRLGASGHAYAPIIASGENACMLHYIKNDQVCSDGDLLLMDFGAEYANYAADCSRTVPVNGKFSKRQRELYDANLNVFKAARQLIKPGTTIDKINEEVGKMWEEEHVRLGLYTAKDIQDQTREDPLYKNYYMHGTSHFMGLDVHDVGSRQTMLKPGMVLTCEPGIYIPEERIGIRIENDILVTEDGNVDIMGDFPVEPEEIEDIMSLGR